MSWKPVFIFNHGGSEERVGNAIRFEGRGEAADYALQKFLAWTQPSDWTTEYSEDLANYRYIDRELVRIEGTS